MKSKENTGDYLAYVKDQCIECGLCTKNCTFLQKYDINLKDYCDRPDLAFSCFRCNKCSYVCPKDLDGNKISFLLRQEEPRYESVVKQKDDYIFKNVPKGKSKDLLYLGCNFPAFYPETTEYFKNLFKKEGFKFSIDCCNNPVESTGFKNTYTQRLNASLDEDETERIVCVCSNCYHLLKKQSKHEVISIYQWLDEYGYSKDIDYQVNVFFPCSDRYNREIFAYIEPHLKAGFNDKYTKTNCCGAGGLASKKETELAEKMRKSIQDDKVYTYCATCSSRFDEFNEVHHLASVLAGLDEKIDNRFFINAVKMKLKK
ncbi:MAG: (Fe-S)-binding protein [Finegoldia sp.]|nr:(Fe-S)-binding protein [Finegoldia sp.]